MEKKDGWRLLRTGIAFLADRQRRLAARNTHRVPVYRPGVEAGAARQALAGRR